MKRHGPHDNIIKAPAPPAGSMSGPVTSQTVLNINDTRGRLLSELSLAAFKVVAAFPDGKEILLQQREYLCASAILIRSEAARSSASIQIAVDAIAVALGDLPE